MSKCVFFPFDTFQILLITCKIDEAFLLVTKENANARDDHGFGVISYVCEYGPDDPELNLQCVSKGVSLDKETNQPAARWTTPIHCAAATNKQKILRTLLDLVQLKNVDSFDFTPLDYTFGSAVGYNGSEMCAKILVDAGADLTRCKRPMPQWLLDFAHNRENVRTSTCAVLELLKRASRVLTKTNNGRNVITLIARCVWSTRGFKIY